MQSRSWEQDGQKRSKVEVLAQDVTFLGSKDGGGSGSQNDNGGGEYDQGSEAPASRQKDVVIEDISDEPIDLSEIPF